MAKLSELIKLIDDEVREGNREKALKMIDKLLAKVPDQKALLARRERVGMEYDMDLRISALEAKYGVVAGE